MGDALRMLLHGEASDRVVKFLRTRGERAHIIAPYWVRDLVFAKSDADWPRKAHWSTDASSVEHTGGITNVIAIAEDAAQERSLVESLFGIENVRVLGLFSDILPALLCGASGFGRSRSTREIKRYAVICIPRSGSRYIISMLTRSGLGAPLEHLRDPLAGLISGGQITFESAFKALEKFGQRNGIFGTKLISTFLIKSCKGGLPDLTAKIGWLAKRGYEFVHLDRPLNDAVISSYVAYRLNRWHFFEKLDSSTRSRLDQLAFDETSIWEEFIRFRTQKIVTRHLADQFGMPTFLYATVQQRVETVVASLCDRLGVEPADLKPGNAQIPVATRNESHIYEDFAVQLAELLRRRENEVAPRTAQALRNAIGIDRDTAKRLARYDAEDCHTESHSRQSAS